MKHNIYHRKFSRDKSQRKALFRAICDSFFVNGKVVTTIEKAKEVKPLLEKMITRARIDTIHNRRLLLSYLYTNIAMTNLMSVFAPSVGNRSGGYLRIVKLGHRKGDGAQTALLSFVDDFDQKSLSIIPASVKSTKS